MNEETGREKEQSLTITKTGEIIVEWINPDASDLVKEIMAEANDEQMKRFRILKGNIYCG